MLLMTAAAGSQQPAQAPANTAQGAASSAPNEQAKDKSPAKTITGKDRRRATKLFLRATKLFEKQEYDAALRDYKEAATLDPENPNYAAATEVARSHEVTNLIQTAARARIRGDKTAEQAALQKAAELDPKNIQVAEHLDEMAADAAARQTKPLYEQGTNTLAPAPTLEPTTVTHSFHLKSDRRTVIQTVFRTFGIEASVDQSVTGPPVRFDIDDATFGQATQAVNMVTDSFTVPLDAHRALVAKDTRENRQQFMRQEYETIYLGGLTTTEMTDIGNLAKNVFLAQQAVVEQGAGTLTIRATTDKLNAFNETLRPLLDGRSQVLLDVRLIQVMHTNQRNTGVQPPQQITAFNVYTEEQAILNQNQALVQEIIASGLASPGDTLAILGILLASGQVSSSIFQNGIALFGGGLTLTGVSAGPVTFNLNLNSSESRELDQVQMHLGDGEEGTHQERVAIPDHDVAILESGHGRDQHSRAHDGGALRKLEFPAHAASCHADHSASGIPGPGTYVQGYAAGDSQRRGGADDGLEDHGAGRSIIERSADSEQPELLRRCHAEGRLGRGDCERGG